MIDAHAGKSETLEQDIDTAARHLRLQVHARGSTATVCAAAPHIAIKAAAFWLSTEQVGIAISQQGIYAVLHSILRNQDLQTLPPAA